jgi:hypothetical protein
MRLLAICPLDFASRVLPVCGSRTFSKRGSAAKIKRTRRAILVAGIPAQKRLFWGKNTPFWEK